MNALRRRLAGLLLAASLGLAASAAPALAASEEHAEGAHGEAAHGAVHGPDRKFYFSVFNFAVLLGVLVWGYRKYAAETFPNRRKALEQAIREAGAAKAAAEAQYKEYRDKVHNLDREIEALTAQFKRDAEADRDRLVAEAEAAAVKVLENAEKSAALEVVRARSELRAEAASLAVELAEKIVTERLTAEDRERLVREYVAELEG